MVCVPLPESVRVAFPPLRVTVVVLFPRLSLKVTVPLGVPAAGETAETVAVTVFPERLKTVLDIGLVYLLADRIAARIVVAISAVAGGNSVRADFQVLTMMEAEPLIEEQSPTVELPS